MEKTLNIFQLDEKESLGEQGKSEIILDKYAPIEAKKSCEIKGRKTSEARFNTRLNSKQADAIEKLTSIPPLLGKQNLELSRICEAIQSNRKSWWVRFRYGMQDMRCDVSLWFMQRVMRKHYWYPLRRDIRTWDAK